jgi:DNA-binding PadR family transcriptional regulator
MTSAPTSTVTDQPRHAVPVGGSHRNGHSHDEPEYDSRLDALLDRIQQLTTAPNPAELEVSGPPQPLPDYHPAVAAAPAAKVPHAHCDEHDGWVPIEPETLISGGLTDGEVEALILKMLNGRAEATGRSLAEYSKLPFRLIDPLLHSMKHDRLIAHKGAAMASDYVYQLTELGRERAKKFAEQCTYFGSAPVPLEAYIESVKHQTLADQHPTEEDLHRAFEDLLIDKKMLVRLGPAINSGRGLFLFGAPGNGKTSIAERITKAFGQYIWIPRSLVIDGEIMRLFDPGMHEESPLSINQGLIDSRKVDHRWVRIRRPTIVVGGELTMDQLEVTLNTSTHVSEAPLQLKSNCGTLVIDDFGRQKMTTDQLLNRWIVPLEKRYDFLNLASGKKIQVPFDQLIVFSTNLEPRDLVDDAFLRRIPYKIEVIDPEEEAFRELLTIMAPLVDVEYDQAAIDYLIETHYKSIKRPFRCCQPRDLLLQIRNYCLYVRKPAKMTPENFDFAIENYFAVM